MSTHDKVTEELSANARRYVKPTPERVHVEMDGDSTDVMVTIAGYAYTFRVHGRSDAEFTLTEYSPGGDARVIAQGAEQ